MPTDRALRCVLNVREVEELSRLRTENERLVQERERMLDFIHDALTKLHIYRDGFLGHWPITDFARDVSDGLYNDSDGGLFGWTPPTFSDDEEVEYESETNAESDDVEDKVEDA